MNRVKSVLAFVLILALGSLSAISQPNRSGPPKLGPPPALKLADIQHFKLSNNLPVVLMEKHGVPVFQINLLVRTGSVNDPQGKSGLANLTASMMEEGAGSRTSLELADAIDFLGASISAFSGMHTTHVSARAPVSKLDSTLALFRDVALRPTFPSEELERARKDRLTDLAQAHSEPSAIASAMLSKTLYGNDHPYGHTATGDEQSLRSFTVGDLQDYYKTYFHPNNATLIVVGDVDPKTIIAKLNDLFGNWKDGDIPTHTYSDVPQVKQRQIFLVDKPDAAQSEIRIARIGTTRATPDYFALQVLNTILGGAFTSRLNMNLRETHGYTYGAFSGFDYRPMPGPFVARAAVQTNVTDKSLTEFMKELNGIMQPIPADELDKAKNYLALRYPENFQTVAQITNQLSDMVTYNLPDNYFNNYVQRVLAVSEKDVENAAKKYLDPSAMDIIVVGDRKVVEKGIDSLGIAPIKNFSIDDVLGKAPTVEGNK